MRSRGGSGRTSGSRSRAGASGGGGGGAGSGTGSWERGAFVGLSSTGAGASAPSLFIISVGCSPPPSRSAGSSPVVERKRSASGPSLMLARLRLAIRQNLRRQLPIVVGRVALGVVL